MVKKDQINENEGTLISFFVCMPMCIIGGACSLVLTFLFVLLMTMTPFDLEQKSYQFPKAFPLIFPFPIVIGVFIGFSVFLFVLKFFYTKKAIREWIFQNGSPEEYLARGVFYRLFVNVTMFWLKD